MVTSIELFSVGTTFKPWPVFKAIVSDSIKSIFSASCSPTEFKPFVIVDLNNKIAS